MELPLKYSEQKLYAILSTFMRTAYSTNLTLSDLLTVIVQLKKGNREFFF
jgi:hypothetical protein